MDYQTHCMKNLPNDILINLFCVSRKEGNNAGQNSMKVSKKVNFGGELFSSIAV